MGWAGQLTGTLLYSQNAFYIFCKPKVSEQFGKSPFSIKQYVKNSEENKEHHNIRKNGI